MTDPITMRLRDLVAEQAKRITALEKHVEALAKGVLRAEASFEEWDGEILMEKTNIYGVEFSGPSE